MFQGGVSQTVVSVKQVDKDFVRYFDKVLGCPEARDGETARRST